MNYFEEILAYISKIYHPYTRDINPTKYDLIWEWINFRYEYDYIGKVVHHEIL